ncbi:MAG: methyltransferase [Eubacteriales bacterium]
MNDIQIKAPHAPDGVLHKDDISAEELTLGGEFVTGVNYSLRLIQKRAGLLFGTDALLLAAFVRGGVHADAAEFGSGSGIVSLLCAVRRKIPRIYAREVQPDYPELTRRNVKLNNLADIIEPVCTDARDFRREVDAVFTNPPYMTVSSGKRNDDDGKYAARHELHGDILDFCRAAARVIRFGGSFYAVYRTDRLCDLVCAMRESGIEPKRIIMTANDVSAQFSMALVEGRRGGRPSLFTPGALFLYDYSSGERRMTDDMRYIYENGEFGERFRLK